MPGHHHSDTTHSDIPPSGSNAAETCATSGFYDSPRGTVAARVLREAIRGIWPDLTGMTVLGLGWTDPYLGLWRGQARALIPAVPHEAQAPAGCLVDEDRLPFPDLSFDRVLLVHALEQAAGPPRFLREIWRVMRDDGRLLVVSPNRLGLWAQAERTPFGLGEPYSPGQVERLLRHGAFRTLRRGFALYTPPLRARLVLRFYRGFEAAGPRLAPSLGGVTLIEAEKDAYAALPAGNLRWRRVLLPDAA